MLFFLVIQSDVTEDCDSVRHEVSGYDVKPMAVMVWFGSEAVMDR